MDSESTDGRRGTRATLKSSLPAYGQVPIWLVQSQPSPAALCVYVVLSYHSMGGQHTAFPAMATLVRETGLSERSVKRGLSELREKGVIHGEQRRSPRGGYASTEYTVLFDQRDIVDQQQQMDDGGAEWDEAAGMTELAPGQDCPPIDESGMPVLSETGVPETPPEDRTSPEKRRTAGSYARGSVPTEPHPGSAPGASQADLTHGQYVDAFVAAVGGGKPVSRNRMGQIVAAVPELRRIEGAIDEIATRWERGLARYGGRLTPIGLVDNWASLGQHYDGGRNGRNGVDTVSRLVAEADALDAAEQAAGGAQR